MEHFKEITLKVQCHCGLASFSLSFPKSDTIFPLKSSVCHCSDCRHSTGMLWGSFAVIPAQRPDFSKLSVYHSSASLSRYFCGKCGASVGNVEPHEWEFATGLLDHQSGDLLNRVQMWVDSTKDGGASIWMPGELYQRPFKRMQSGRDSEEVSQSMLDSMCNSKPTNPDKLHGSCHCGKVQFYITRPAEDARDNKHTDGRYHAAPCPCESCRLTSGFEWLPWTYVPPSNICNLDGTPFTIDQSSLTHYSSSSRVCRSFCNSCGAKVFYRTEGRDPDLWDIAVGLFNGEGARLEDWIEWAPEELLDLDDASDQEFCRALAKGVSERYAAITRS